MSVSDRVHPKRPDCDGIAYPQIDPFAEEIYGDDSEYLMCDCEAHESAMDI